MTVTSMPKTETEEPKRRPIKLIAFIVVLAIAAAAGWFLVLAPKEDPNAEPEPPKPGLVVPLEPMQINLSDGHYLRVGIALQMVESDGGGHGDEEVDGSRALDALLDVFSGQSMAQVMAHDARAGYKQQLLLHLKEPYEEHVMDVYFTEYVAQ